MNIGIFCKQFLGQGGFPREWRRFSLELAQLGEHLRIYSYPGVADPNLHPNATVLTFPGPAESSFRIPGDLRKTLGEHRDWLDGVLIVGGFVPENITVMFWLRHFGIPYVVAPLGQLAPKVIKRGGWKKLPFLRGLLVPALKRAAAIHAFSDIEAEWVHRYVQRPAIVATHGAYPEDLPSSIDRNYLRTRFPFIGRRKIILFLGRLDIYWKGLDTLIKGFGQVSAGHDNMVLAIIGPDQNNNRRTLEDLIAQEGLTDKAFILEPIFGNEKFSAVASADVFAYPSNYDILPRSVREALTLGCPVLVSDETQFGGLVRAYSAGAVCEVTTDSIARTLSFLLADDRQLAHMRENAKRLATEKLDWTGEAAKLRDGLKEAFAPLSKTRIPDANSC